MSKIVQLPVQVSKVQTMKDGSVKLSLETRELGGEAMAQVFGFRQQEIWAILAKTAEETESVEVPEEKPDSLTGQKSQASRLRNVIYILWKQKGSNGDFETFYRSYTEKIIEQIKEKLDDQ